MLKFLIIASVFKQHVRVTPEQCESILPNSEGDVGLPASCSGPSVLGDKIGEESASAIPPNNAEAQKKRKCGRE